ncbi:MAG: ATP-binding protein, partial [Thermoproteota archaeon]|nr:ATP-binding protein [Thermoproteota archaeon]
HGEQNVISTVLQFTSKAKSRIDACVDYTRPSLTIEIEELRKAFLDAKRRGIRLRYVTEITEDNVVYCKELLKMVDELRHIEGIKGNFYISETEYIAPATLHTKGKPASHIVYSNVKEIVEQQRQFVFDSFWSRAIPAEQKIKEIEEGITHYETRVVEDPEQIIEEISRLTANSTQLATCLTPGGIQYSYNYFFKIKRKLLEKQREGKHRGIRYITKIEKEKEDNIELVKTYLNSGIQIRHVKNLPPMSFGVSDKEMSATIEKMEGGKKIQSLLISTEPLYIQHFTSIFEELWKNGIDARDRIKDIESGIDLADIEVIPSSSRARDLYLDIVKAASKEILWIIPTTNALIRQDKIGAIPLAVQAAKERNVKVRILIPANNIIEQKLQQLKEYCPVGTIDVRYIEQMSETKATILVVDRKDSMVMELKDDSKSTFDEAIGLSTHSNSKAGVLSYVAIFEKLWKQSELYEQLKIHDKMQREFINIAAHELRTPIQPILGLSEVVLCSTKDAEQAKLLEIINRNAKRLQRLTEDILDVTKIESQSLNLKKEQFNLNEVITNAMDDITTNKIISSSCSKTRNPIIKLLCNIQDTFVYADKERISQVILNLLNNAVKFTKDEKGIITVIVGRKDHKNEEQYNNQEIVVSIQDTGQGIDPQIFPRLYSKFATKSETGTGLGLFICKGIVEAHCGKIWAENNKDGKGATFSFSLPLSKL